LLGKIELETPKENQNLPAPKKAAEKKSAKPVEEEIIEIPEVKHVEEEIKNPG